MLIPGPNKRDHRVIWIIQDNGVLRTSLRDSAQCSVTFKQHPEVFQEPLQQLHLLYGRGTWQILAKGASYRPYGNNHETKTLHGSILSNRRMQMCSLWSSRTSIDNDPCVDDLPPNAWLLLFSMATSMSASMSARKLPQRMGFFPMFSAHIPNILAPHTNAWSTGLQRWWVSDRPMWACQNESSTFSMSSVHRFIRVYYTSWWFQPAEKWWSEWKSVGMIIPFHSEFPFLNGSEWKVNPNSMVPVTTNQLFHSPKKSGHWGSGKPSPQSLPDGIFVWCPVDRCQF